MTNDEFNQFCSALAATSHVVQWGDADVWKVGGKVFAIAGWGIDKQVAFTFKTSSNNFDFLREHPDYRPAPYFANRGMKWIQIVRSSEENDGDLKYYLIESYRIVSLGLSKIMQKELGLNQKVD
jgi:predicted DNA-binding protein (MmcQ/YjbR family)